MLAVTSARKGKRAVALSVAINRKQRIAPKDIVSPFLNNLY